MDVFTLALDLRGDRILIEVWDCTDASPEVIRPDGLYQSQQRFSLYRWHLADPVRFKQDIRVEVQALGWRSEHRFLPLHDDIASVAFWYQQLPTAPFRPLPLRNDLEII